MPATASAQPSSRRRSAATKLSLSECTTPAPWRTSRATASFERPDGGADEMALLQKLEDAVLGNETEAASDENALRNHDKLPS